MMPAGRVVLPVVVAVDEVLVGEVLAEGLVEEKVVVVDKAVEDEADARRDRVSELCERMTAKTNRRPLRKSPFR